MHFCELRMHPVQIVSFLICVGAFTKASSSSSRSIGGEIEGIQLPTLALFIDKNNNVICQGVFIFTTAILTTCTCGFREQIVGVKTDLITNTLKIKDKIRHPGFKPSIYLSSNPDNIAIIIIERPSDVSKCVRGIEFEDSEKPPETTVAAYGRDLTACPKTNNLKRLGVTIQSEEECAKKLRMARPDKFYCLTDPNKALCPVDDGMPIIFNSTLIGLATPYSSCGTGAPDLVIRPSQYLHWIWTTLQKSSVIGIC